MEQPAQRLSVSCMGEVHRGSWRGLSHRGQEVSWKNRRMEDGRSLVKCRAGLASPGQWSSEAQRRGHQ